MNTIISPEAKKALEVGRANHWRFRTVQIQQEWVYETVEVPQIGKDRINVLKAAGVRIKGFVIAHEAPRLLPAPKVEEKIKILKSTAILPALGTVVSAIATGVSWFLYLAFMAIAMDPALIVELEDGTWLEILTWYD